MADTNDETKPDETNDEIAITLKFRGAADAVVDALVHGMPREALMDFHAALETEMAKRSRQRRETWPTRTQEPELASSEK